MALGLKPMCRFGLTRSDDETVAALRRFAELSGLALEVYRSSYETSPEPMIMAARDPARLDAFKACVSVKAAARTAADTARETARMGRLLGYPACCVKAFVAAEKTADGAPRAWAFPRALLRRPARAIPYGLNFLYNFHSRSSGPDRELETMLRGGYRLMEAYLLPWIPCSWTCAPSRAFAQKLEAALAARLPDVARGLREILSLPVLVIDGWRFVPLSGASAGGRRLSYAGTVQARTLASKEITALLERGGVLRETARGVVISRAGKIVGSVPGARLFDFSGG